MRGNITLLAVGGADQKVDATFSLRRGSYFFVLKRQGPYATRYL